MGVVSAVRLVQEQLVSEEALPGTESPGDVGENKPTPTSLGQGRMRV